MPHDLYWRSEENEAEDAINPKSRVADHADTKLRRAQEDFRQRVEEEYRRWQRSVP